MVYVVLIVLLAFSSVFSSLETGLLALGEVKARRWTDAGVRNLEQWLTKPSAVITGILLGNNLVNIIFSSLFTVIVVNMAGIGEHLVEPVAIVFSSVFLLTFGEILPKNVAHAHPDKTVRLFYGPFMKFFSFAGPVSGRLNKISFALLGGAGKNREKGISRKEMPFALDDMQKRSLIDREHTGMMLKAMTLTHKSVGEVMTQREKIYAVNLQWSYERTINSLLKSRFSRIPVYSGHLDNIKGLVYLKDVIGELNLSGKLDMEKILRKPYFTDPGRSCQYLFQDLRRKRIHCTLVKNGTRLAGLISVEDIIEEIVGEIYDEYDNRDIDT